MFQTPLSVPFQEHNVAKVETHVTELFEKTDKNEKGLADSLDTLERKVPIFGGDKTMASSTQSCSAACPPERGIDTSGV